MHNYVLAIPEKLPRAATNR